MRFRLQFLGITKENVLLLWEGATSYLRPTCASAAAAATPVTTRRHELDMWWSLGMLGDLQRARKPSCRKSSSFPCSWGSADICFLQAGLWFLRSSSKADVSWAETCQISWPLWHAPNIHIPRGSVRWCVPRPKAVGLLALKQALSSQAAPGDPAPKSSFPPSLAKWLPLKPLYFPNNPL